MSYARDITPILVIGIMIAVFYVSIFWAQINTMPHEMIYLFLPHGVRMLAFILLRHASIPVMIIAQFTAGYFLDDIYPAASIILFAGAAISTLCPVIGYWLLRFFRIDPVPTDISKPLHWGYLLLFLAASTLFNGTCIAFLQVFVAGIDANYFEFAGALMVGDILGSLAVVVGYFLVKNSFELGQKLYRRL